MAKYILVGIAAQYIHTNLAVRALESYLGEDHGFALQVRDFTINQPLEYIYGELIRENPEVILLSCYIWNRAYCDALVRRIHTASPEIAVFMGGPEASWQARALLEQQPGITGVFTGEGEASFSAFLAAWERGDQSWQSVPGLVWRWQEQIVANAEAPLLDMANLPQPYGDDLVDTANRIIYYESSRGCPFRCAYCLSSLDKSVRERPLEQVFRDLDVFIKAQVRQVKFIDRTFNATPQRAMAIWRFLKERDNNITNFHFEVTADILTDEALNLLATLRPGLLQFEIGVQSTHPPTLKAVHRQMDLQRLTEVVGRLKESDNIHLHLDLIAGLPYEGLTSFQQSFDDVFRLAPHALQLGFLKVLPGTELARKADFFGLRYDPCAPYDILTTPDLSPQDMRLLKDVEEVLNVYHNTGRFGKSLAYLLAFTTSPFTLFLHLAEIWRRLNLYGIHTGIRQEGEALRILSEEIPESDGAVFATALAFDLCAREKPRRWPQWLKNPILAEHETRRFLEERNLVASLQDSEGTARHLARQNALAYFPRETVPPGLAPGYYLFTYADRDIAGNAKALHLPEKSEKGAYHAHSDM